MIFVRFGVLELLVAVFDLRSFIPSLGPAMQYNFMPCGQATPKTASWPFQGWPSSFPLDTPCHMSMLSLGKSVRNFLCHSLWCRQARRQGHRQDRILFCLSICLSSPLPHRSFSLSLIGIWQ
jgi:hypothetical protein